MRNELLAWSQYPEPTGTGYAERDLADAATLADLLDRAQVHRAWIAREGWQTLWRLYGLDGLLKLNETGHWFETDAEATAAQQIVRRALVAGFDPEARESGLQFQSVRASLMA